MNVWIIVGGLLALVAGIATIRVVASMLRGHDAPPVDPAPDDSLRLSVSLAGRDAEADDEECLEIASPRATRGLAVSGAGPSRRRRARRR